jgi:hypothetical protein
MSFFRTRKLHAKKSTFRDSPFILKQALLLTRKLCEGPFYL